MKLYVVKTNENYLKANEDDPAECVPMNKASVFTLLEDAVCLRDHYGSGSIAELRISEKILDL